MRRLLTILLLAAFALPVVAPLLAQGQDPDASLPICCRRNGAHHCTMGSAELNSKATISARCPSFPQQSTFAPHTTLAAFTTSRPAIKLPFSTLSATARAETQRRISIERSHHKRGPPAAILAA